MLRQLASKSRQDVEPHLNGVQPDLTTVVPAPARNSRGMRRFQVIKKEVKLESILARLIERDGYSRNRKPILDSINVTAAALSQYVRGRTRPSFDKLLALSSFFDVTL